MAQKPSVVSPYDATGAIETSLGGDTHVRLVCSGASAEVAPSPYVSYYREDKRRKKCDIQILHWVHPGFVYRYHCERGEYIEGLDLGLPAVVGGIPRRRGEKKSLVESEVTWVDGSLIEMAGAE